MSSYWQEGVQHHTQIINADIRGVPSRVGRWHLKPISSLSSHRTSVLLVFNLSYLCFNHPTTASRPLAKFMGMASAPPPIKRYSWVSSAYPWHTSLKLWATWEMGCRQVLNNIEERTALETLHTSVGASWVLPLPVPPSVHVCGEMSNFHGEISK